MLFNSLEFAVFFVVVYSLYLALQHKWQNRLLLVGSYFFYGSWDWRFLSLIFVSTALDYLCGLKIHSSRKEKKKLFLFLSIFGNLSILGFFKYFNFFASSLQETLSVIGVDLSPQFLDIILPVGISFYTFQSMSYTIDIYKGELKPTRNLLDFALFVAFFPQLVAGPIERAKRLLPQVASPRFLKKETFSHGCYLILWGLFLKIFIADNLALIVEPVFSRPPPYNGLQVLLATYAFAFQIFGDFAGYSNIARGLGKLMGFDLLINFRIPYFAVNPVDFWRRWHISLSTWLRDYLYIPLGGNKRGKLITLRNLSLTMILGGLWHGAAWTFVAWGIYHGVLLVLHRLLQPLFNLLTPSKSAFMKRLWVLVRVVFVFHLVCLGWLFFRAQSMSQASSMLSSLIFNFSIPAEFSATVAYILYFTFFLILVQLFQHFKEDMLIFAKGPVLGRALFVVAIIYLSIFVMMFGVNAHIGGGSEFIYFQF